MKSDRPSVPAWLQAARDKWRYRGTDRPAQAVDPKPGQESVWDYPRPPDIVAQVGAVVVADSAGERLAASTRALRVRETASPPTVYLPPADVAVERLVSLGDAGMCEWKGQAHMYGLASSADRTPVAWSYPRPFPGFEAIAGWLAFYPGRVHCTVDGEPVRPQPGDFYGGWITNELVGPFKGARGTESW